jgi:hypothetical protein
MTEDRAVVPGMIEGFLSGCPFCASRRLAIPETGTRFRIISGTFLGSTGIATDGTPYGPNEFIAHLDGETPDQQVRVCMERTMIQLFPFAPVPAWAPHICMSEAAEIDRLIISLCEHSFSKGMKT